MKGILNKIEPYFFLIKITLGVILLAVSLSIFEVIYASLHLVNSVDDAVSTYFGSGTILNAGAIISFLVGLYLVKRGYYDSDFLWCWF